MTRRGLLRAILVGGAVLLSAPPASALELRVAQFRASASRVAVTMELRDLLRDKFLELIREGRSIFLQVQAELWEDRRIADRLTLTTPVLTYRVVGNVEAGVVITDQYGNGATHTDVRLPVPVRVDLGPASSILDDRSYYLRAQVTAATVADSDIDQMGAAIFGDGRDEAGLASLGRFVFRTLLRIGKYLESANAELTTGRYTGQQIKAGAM
ncbi:MAG: hypothetical protein HY657_18625 [Acidobacteria bacterium]|nr:hypothetical protein [Acidobacteriota bacterium]